MPMPTPLSGLIMAWAQLSPKPSICVIAGGVDRVGSWMSTISLFGTLQHCMNAATTSIIEAVKTSCFKP